MIWRLKNPLKNLLKNFSQSIKNYSLFVLPVFISSVFLLLFLAPVSFPGSEARIGKDAPDFTLSDLDGKSFSLSKAKGRGVIHLTFTAVWCVPCRQEIPKLNEAYERFKSEGYILVAIGVPTRETPERLKEYAEKEKIRFPILFDASGSVAESYGAEFLPKSILIDKKGVVRYEWDFVPDNFHEILSKLLKE